MIVYWVMTCWTLSVPIPKLRRAYEIQMIVTPAVIIGMFTGHILHCWRLHCIALLIRLCLQAYSHTAWLLDEGTLIGTCTMSNTSMAPPCRGHW
jgi:hypothetical protein